MTADPVTAAVLAEALREAVANTDDLFERGVFDGGESMKAARTIHRWQGIIDRYDAQRLADLPDEIEHALWDRGQCVLAARQARSGGSDRIARYWIESARAANHRFLALRRQLRALGGEG